MAVGVVLDMDNTLYDWNRYFGGCFRAMVHALSRATGNDEDALYGEFRDVFARWGSLEYSFAIQELACARSLPSDELKELIRVGRGAFSRVRRRRLVPYEGVVRTLKWGREQGIVFAVVSNAPFYLAARRLRQLGLDGFMEGLVAPVGAEGDGGRPDATVGFAVNQEQPRTRLRWVIRFANDDVKPSKVPYELALNELGLRADEAWAMGDSLEKDLRPAKDMGMATIWARYGTERDDRDLETIRRVTPWSNERFDRQYSVGAVAPDHSVASFAEIECLLPARQASLFDFMT